MALRTGYYCSKMTEKMLKKFEYYLGKNHAPIKPGFQWISYAVCTFHIFIQLEHYCGGCCICCLSVFILSSFDYLVKVDFFTFILSFLWSWIMLGRLIFFVSLKLLPKPWSWVLITIIAVVVKLYFIHLTFFHYVFIYIFLILGYVLFRLILFPLKYLLF